MISRLKRAYAKFVGRRHSRQATEFNWVADGHRCVIAPAGRGMTEGVVIPSFPRSYLRNPVKACPYPIVSWSRTYQPGDFFDASAHFSTWLAYAGLRWIGADGRYYFDLFLDPDEPERKTGAASFTRAEIEEGFELCGGPTCRAEMRED